MEIRDFAGEVMTKEEKARSLIGKQVYYCTAYSHTEIEGICVAAAGEFVRIKHSECTLLGSLGLNANSWVRAEDTHEVYGN